MSEGGPREVRLPAPPGGSLVWVAGAGAVALVALAVASASGPVPVVEAAPPGSASSVLVTLPTFSTTTPPLSDASSGPDVSQLPDLPPVVGLALRLLVWGLIAWGVYLLLRLIWRRFPRLRTRVLPTTDLAPLPSVPDELLDTAPARLLLLQQGSPSNAIVACWVDLEDSATAAGLPRRPAETSAEYTVRVLRTWDIAPDAMGALAELYREARHSRHVLSERHRAEAVQCLEAIHADLRRVVDEASPADARGTGLPGGGAPR